MYGKTPYMGLSVFHPSKNHSKKVQKTRSYFFVIQENNRIFALKFY